MRSRSTPLLAKAVLLAGVASGLALLPAVALRAAHAGDALTTERYRDKNWKFSFLKFKEWPQVPLETKGSGPRDPFEACLVARFNDAGNARASGIARIFRMVGGAPGGQPAITGDAPASPPPAPPPPAGPGPGGEARPADMVALIEAYLSRRIQFESHLLAKGEKEIKSKDGVPGRMWSVDVPGVAHFTIGIWSKDAVEVGLVFGCAESDRKKLEAPLAASCRSFRWYDERAEDAESLPQLEGLRISPRKRREIETGLVDGWDVVVSPKKNYVVVYNTKGRTNTPLARMMAERIEQIRAQVYEVQFPPARAIETVSIVRLCGGVAEYRHYGGPPGSAGYWNDDTEELVFYDASPRREADDDTLAVLYHEAFHQYIYYSVGKVAPHSWFNEGHGDYYAGSRYVDGKFVIRPFAWRVPVLKSALQNGPCDFDVVQRKGEMVRKWDRTNRGYSPIAQLVEMAQGEYYAYPGVSYAQGWSLVYFLREIVPKNPKWHEKWGKILTTYFDTLKAEVARIEAAEASPPVTPRDPPAPGAPTTPTDPTAPPPAPTPAPPAPGAPAPPPGPEPTPPAGPAPEPPAGPTPPPADPGAEGPPSEVGIALTGPRYPSSALALRKALRTAFDGVDLEELEIAWKEAMSKVNVKK